MASANETPIVFLNNTGDSNLEVAVFTKNFSKKTDNQDYVAWQVLKGKSKMQNFVYSNQVSIAAEYKHAGLKVKCGPFQAKHGSTWRIFHEKHNDTAMLSEGIISISQAFS